jgi:hypothetical protein
MMKFLNPDLISFISIKHYYSYGVPFAEEFESYVVLPLLS